MSKIGVFVRSEFNYDMGEVSKSCGLWCEGDVNRAQQQFKEDCDINEIVRRFGLTGELPEIVRVPMSGDFTEVLDYQSALNAVMAADAAFMELPASVRERFANDPQRLMEFVQDDKNRSEAEKLGLLKEKYVPVRDAVTAIDDLAKVLTGKVKPE